MIFHQYKQYQLQRDPMPAPGTVMVTSTSTHTSKHGDWVLDEIMEFVRDASSDEDAIHNLKKILKRYDRRIKSLPWYKRLFKIF